MASLKNAVRICKRVTRAAPSCSSLLNVAYPGSYNSSRQLSTILRPIDVPTNAVQQQCAYKTKNAKKGQSQIKVGNVNNFISSQLVNMNEVNGRMASEVHKLAQTLIAINVNSNPAVLSSVSVRIGVEKLPITDLCNIVSEPGKPLLLDCSLYSEYKEAILEAVTTETAFEALPHGSDAIKLVSPKLTSELRTRLVTQAKTQANQTTNQIKKIRNEADEIARKAKCEDRMIKSTTKKIHEIYLHHKSEASKMFKVKEKKLQEEFNL